MTPCSRAQSVKYRYAVLRQHREPTNRSSNGDAVAADWAEGARSPAGGPEAPLRALRLARGVPGPGRVVKRAGLFHGGHDRAAPGAAPPFDTPDTAGLPQDISGSVAVIPATEPEMSWG